MILYGFILYSNRSRKNTNPGIFSDEPKKKCTFDFSSQDEEFLSMALAVLSSNSESYLPLLPQCSNHHPEKMHFWYYRSRRLSLVGDARLYSSTQEAGAGEGQSALQSEFQDSHGYTGNPDLEKPKPP